MAFRYIHWFRKYDEDHGEWFRFYRFPYSPEAGKRIKSLPKGRYCWRPDYKAWGIHEAHATDIEQFLTDLFGLGMCPGCGRQNCRAWTHLGAEQPRPRRTPHWETAEERARAQQRYEREQRERWRKESERAYWGDPEDDEQDPFAATEPPQQETPPPPSPNGRWAPPLNGRPDSVWCMRVLGLSVLPASKANLKALYRRLALEFHPDLNHEMEGDSSKMALINVARDYLESYLS
jgi:hypothetical protein